MTPVMQNIEGPEGNCFEACVASILDLPLESVSDFGRDDDWYLFLLEWLDDRDLDGKTHKNQPPGLAIGVQKIQPTGATHAVVYQDGVMIHDPSARKIGRQENKVLAWYTIGAVPCSVV